jgi:heptosyltransferase II
MTPTLERILVRGVNWLGDAVMSMPALDRLREAHPNARISLLTAEKLSDLWRLHPAVNQVLAFSQSDTVFSIARRLRAGRFDAALIFPNSPRSALEAFLARIPRRIGYARPWRNWLLTQAITPRPEAALIRPRSIADLEKALATPGEVVSAPRSIRSHHIFDYLHLAEALGAQPVPSAPWLPVSPALLEEAKKWLPSAVPAGGWFGLNPGAEYGPAKRWPAKNFIDAALEIHRQKRCGWILFGGRADKALADEIAGEIQRSGAVAVNLAGNTTLPQLCAALKMCEVLLTNDTGPMHLAAAAGVRVGVPFGSTSPELTGPGLPGEGKNALLKAKTACSPCFRRVCPIQFQCMQSITVEQVVAAVVGRDTNFTN